MDNKEKKINNKKILQDSNLEQQIQDSNLEQQIQDSNLEQQIQDSNLEQQNKKIENFKIQLLNNKKKINDIELRKLAKIENIKKNTKEKIKKIKNMQIETFLKQIIPIIDSLEDILQISDRLNIKDTPLIQGIELTLQSLFNILYKLGVKIEGKKDEPFNSDIHIPIEIESSETAQPNNIISIKQKGFSFKNVLLRKAIVTIPKN